MVPGQHAREARHTHEQAANDELNVLSSVGPDKKLLDRSVAENSSRDGEKTGEWKMVPNESKNFSQSSMLESSMLEVPVPSSSVAQMMRTLVTRTSLMKLHSTVPVNPSA